MVGLDSTGVIRRLTDERKANEEFDLTYDCKGNGLVAGNGTRYVEGMTRILDKNEKLKPSTLLQFQRENRITQ